MMMAAVQRTYIIGCAVNNDSLAKMLNIIAQRAVNNPVESRDGGGVQRQKKAYLRRHFCVWNEAAIAGGGATALTVVEGAVRWRTVLFFARE